MIVVLRTSASSAHQLPRVTRTLTGHGFVVTWLNSNKSARLGETKRNRDIHSTSVLIAGSLMASSCFARREGD